MPVQSLEEYERLNPRCELVHDGIRVVYSTPNVHTRWRVDSLLTKEPSTIAWIAGFSAGDVLVDVGANVGMYSIWAAKTRGARVYAFEPEAQNFALLNRNIVLNELAGRVSAYCAALSDTSALGELHLSELRAGGSCHSFGEKLDFKHEPMQPAYSQGCVSLRLDDLVARGTLPCPAHVKIDVDGFEPKVIAGARETLRDPRVRSMSIEVNRNLEDHRAMVLELTGLGFRHDPAQVAAVERRDGPFKGCAEYVFKR
jgi:FkbM family methyltransferase